MAKVAHSNDSEVPNGKRKLITRWQHEELFQGGWLGVPSLFLQHYAHLKPYCLTTGEALFVLHLMDYKWDENHPFPGYKTLAKRMGTSDKMARRHGQSLEQKGYLKREIRIGQTNRFDLSPLFDALKTVIEISQKKPRKKPAKSAKGLRLIERKSYPSTMSKIAKK